MVEPLHFTMVSVVMTNERDKRNISNFVTYSVKKIHIGENQQVSSWNLYVCRGQAASLLHGRGRCRDDESDTQNKNKYLHLTTILFFPRSIMFYFFYICLGQAAMSTLQGKIILSIKGSHDVYQEFILLLQTDSKLLLWLIFEDALMLQIATSHFTVTLQ